MPGLPTWFTSVRACSRLNAGPAARVVAKIHNARKATNGTVTNAMIFERIDQLRVLIMLRPRGWQLSAPRSADGRQAGVRPSRAAYASARIRKTFNRSYLVREGICG